MFVFPDERFTKYPPDDAETIEPGTRVSKTKTKGDGVPVCFLNNAAGTKKALRISSGAFLCRADNMLINFNKVRIARADHALRIHKAVHVNRDPAAVHEHEVRVANQPEMSLPEPLDEELFRMPPKTEYFAVTRPELLLVHRRCLIRASHVSLAGAPHVCLARARTCGRLIPVYLRSAALDVCVCARLRFCLWFGLLLLGAHLLAFRGFRGRCCLRFVRLPLRRLLWFRLA